MNDDLLYLSPLEARERVLTAFRGLEREMTEYDIASTYNTKMNKSDTALKILTFQRCPDIVYLGEMTTVASLFDSLVVTLTRPFPSSVTSTPSPSTVTEIPSLYIRFVSYSISNVSSVLEPVVSTQRYSRGCGSPATAGGSENDSVWKMIEGSPEGGVRRMKGAYPSANGMTQLLRRSERERMAVSLRS